MSDNCFRREEEIILFVFLPKKKKKKKSTEETERAAPVKSRPIRDKNQSKSCPTQDQIWQWNPPVLSKFQNESWKLN